MMMVSWQSLWAAVKDVCLGKEYSRPEEDTEDYGNGSTWTRGRFLGEGSFGSVFLTTSNSKGSMPEVMAVKSTEMWRSDTLKHERTVLKSLVGCPDVIQCFGSEITQKTDGSHIYNLLLEFASGGTLHDRIQSSKGKGLPESEVRWYTRSIVRGLYRIHRAEYVHCDMKPENILLVPTTLKGHKFKAKICDLLVPTSLKGHQLKAKICDFGLAKGAEEDRQKSEVDRKHWNGTLMYASPEAVKIGLQEPSSDIWSLGIIVLEMLTGRPAWDLEQGSGSESERVLQKLKRGSLPKIPKHLSSEARNFLKMCLRRTAKNRPTASSLCQHPFLHDDHNADSDIMPGSGVEDPVNLTRNCIPSELMPELLPETRICPSKSISLENQPILVVNLTRLLFDNSNRLVQSHQQLLSGNISLQISLCEHLISHHHSPSNEDEDENGSFNLQPGIELPHSRAFMRCIVFSSNWPHMIVSSLSFSPQKQNSSQISRLESSPLRLKI